MVLANLDAESRRGEVGMVAEYLMTKQKPNGSWDYSNRDAGDSSISQYAVLGLWEAANAGADVPPTVFDRAARWYMETQWADGGWSFPRGRRVQVSEALWQQLRLGPGAEQFLFFEPGGDGTCSGG